jgi:hypothetical protein
MSIFENPGAQPFVGNRADFSSQIHWGAAYLARSVGHFPRL